MPFANSTIDVRAIDDLIVGRGEWVKYFPGSRCPCGSDPGHPDFACPNCNGLGHFYPHPPQDLKAIIANVKMNRDPFGIPGFALPGDMYMGARPARGRLPHIYDFDMVMLTWPEGIPLEGEDVIADPSGIDALANPIVQVKSAFGIDPNNPVAVNFIVTYTPGVDFILLPPSGSQLYPQSIQWVTSNRPTPGAKYVVKYSCQPQWIAFSPPEEHYERSTSLGQSVLLRKRSIVMAQNQ